MKKQNIKLYHYILSLFMFIGLTSCVNDLNVTPIDPSTIQTFNQDEVFAKVYASWALTGQQGAAGMSDVTTPDEGRFSLTRSLWNCSELCTDEALCQWGDAEVIDMNKNSWTSSNASVQAVYARLYFIITISNSFLDQTSGKNDDQTIKQRAEVRFLRALSYSYLIDLYGNVPFATSISAESPKQITRANLFNWIVTELKSIEGDMYGLKQAPYYRVDKAANWLLLSRLYLNAKVYTGTAKWDSAAIYANKLIVDNTSYKLASKYKYLFMADNAGAIDGSTVNDAPNEIIFPIAADSVQTTNWGSSIFLICSTRSSDMPAWGLSASGWEGNRARAALLNKFFPSGNVPAADSLVTAAGDDRALFYSTNRTHIITKTAEFKQGISVIKYSNVRSDGKYKHHSPFPDMDIPFMRKAEAYLNYAEAVTRGAAPIGGLTALNAINTLRTRAHVTPLTSLSLDVILDEWAREFYFEGHRRSDLIRFGYFGGQSDYNWDWKAGVSAGTLFDSHYNLMPIPADDMNANANLVQNPGYN